MRNYPLMSEEEENEIERKVHNDSSDIRRTKPKPPTMSDYEKMIMKEEENEKKNIHKYLLSLIPQEEQDRVFNQRYCDITPDFMGFVDIYYYLSKTIPKHWTVVDLGCGYNAQSYFFMSHVQYIAVDIGYIEEELTEMFKPPNCGIYRMTIKEFIKEYLDTIPSIDTTFAICNYVPSWYGDNRKLVKSVFENVYVFYPHSE